jgi:hypothetical protein
MVGWILPLAIGLTLIYGCNAQPSEPDATMRTYELVAAFDRQSNRLAVPAAIVRSGVDDYDRFISGRFALTWTTSDSGTWSMEVRVEEIRPTEPVRQRIISEGGQFQVTERSDGELVLQVVPDGPVLTHLTTIAVVRGDTLAWSVLEFVRR